MNRDDLFKLVKAWADEVTDGNGYVTYEFDPPALVRFVECVIEEEREWQGLTDGQKKMAYALYGTMTAEGFVKSLETKLKENNT